MAPTKSGFPITPWKMNMEHKKIIRGLVQMILFFHLGDFRFHDIFQGSKGGARVYPVAPKKLLAKGGSTTPEVPWRGGKNVIVVGVGNSFVNIHSSYD